MPGINTGILTKAYPLSTEQIANLEKSVLDEGTAVVYLSEKSELCFAAPVDPGPIKELAWHNAYELTSDTNNNRFKKVYKKRTQKTFDLDTVLQKRDNDSNWYHNQVRTSIVGPDGNIYNGTGYMNGHRLSSSGVMKELKCSAHTGFIQVKGGDAVRISGMNFGNGTQHGSAVNAYDGEFKLIGQFSMASGEYGIFLQGYSAYGRGSVEKENGKDVWKWIVPPTDSGVAYIRISANMGESYDSNLETADGSLLIVTVNEEI
jgi:hypothetical protein